MAKPKASDDAPDADLDDLSPLEPLTADEAEDDRPADESGETDPRAQDGEDAPTLPVEAGGEILQAPAAAVLDPGPPPVTPSSSAQQYDDRVAYESFVNAQVEDFIARTRAEVTDAFLAGNTPRIEVDDTPAE